MSGFFVQNVWMIPCLPLLGALIAAIGARRLQSMPMFRSWRASCWHFFFRVGAFFGGP